MKTVFALTLSFGLSNAAQLRKDSVVTKKDTAFVEALAGKYNCREVSATLQETVIKVTQKIAVKKGTLNTECSKREEEYTTVWNAAKEVYATEFPKIEPEEIEKYKQKVEAADKLFKDGQSEQQVTVEEYTKKETSAQSAYDATVDHYDVAFGAHSAAVDQAHIEEQNYQHVVKPAGIQTNLKVFNEAKEMVDKAFTSTTEEAKTAQTNVISLCKQVTAERKKHIDADEKILLEDIAPLVKRLTELKCYDAGTNSDGDTVSLLEVKNQAKCAMTSSKVQSLIEVTSLLSGIPLNDQFTTFTDRVDAERKHMAQVDTSCVTHANHQFDTDKIAARHRQNTKMNDITSARQASDAVLDETFIKMQQTNNKNIEALAAEIIAPHDAKIAASKVLVNAKSEVAATEFTIKAQLEVLTNQHTTALAEALATKTDDIKFRQNSLAVVKTTAQQAFDTDKILVDEYCKSTGDGKIFLYYILKVVLFFFATVD